MAQAKKALKHNTRNKASKKYVKKSNLRKTKKSVKRRTYRKRTIKGGVSMNIGSKEEIMKKLDYYAKFFKSLLPKFKYKSHIYDVKYRLLREIKKLKGCKSKGINEDVNKQDEINKHIESLKEEIKNAMKNCGELDDHKENVKSKMNETGYISAQLKRFKSRHDWIASYNTNPIMLSNKLFEAIILYGSEDENSKNSAKITFLTFFAKTNKEDIVKNAMNNLLDDTIPSNTDDHSNIHKLNDGDNEKNKEFSENMENEVDKNIEYKVTEDAFNMYEKFKTIIMEIDEEITKDDANYITFEEFNYLFNLYKIDNNTTSGGGEKIDFMKRMMTGESLCTWIVKHDDCNSGLNAYFSKHFLFTLSFIAMFGGASLAIAGQLWAVAISVSSFYLCSQILVCGGGFDPASCNK